MIHIQTAGMSPVQKIVATFLGLAILVLGVTFSVVLLPVLAIVGAVGFAYVYWKTRALRKAMAQMVRNHGAHDVIEGEAVVIREHHEVKRLD